MNIINQQKSFIDEISNLLQDMSAEIEVLRSIAYRYHLMHGDKVNSGVLELKDNISFAITGEMNGDVKCTMVDCKELGIESRYEKIKSKMKILIYC